MAAIAALLWFVRVERRAENPILPPALMVQRAIGPAMLASALMGVGFFSVDAYVPLYVQGTTGAAQKQRLGSLRPSCWLGPAVAYSWRR